MQDEEWRGPSVRAISVLASFCFGVIFVLAQEKADESGSESAHGRSADD
jgi:hypothetical protein